MNSNEFGPYQVVQLPGAKKDEVSGQLYCDVAINCYTIIVEQIWNLGSVYMTTLLINTVILVFVWRYSIYTKSFFVGFSAEVNYARRI